MDRGRQDLRQWQGAVIAQHQQPCAKSAGHDRRQQPGARHEVKAQLTKPFERRGLRRHALTTDHLDAAFVFAVDEDRHLTAGPVQVRLDDLQHKSPRRRGIECIATSLENAHRSCRSQPVCGGSHSEGAFQFRAGRKHPRLSHCGSSLCGIMLAASAPTQQIVMLGATARLIAKDTAYHVHVRDAAFQFGLLRHRPSGLDFSARTRFASSRAARIMK